MTKMKFNPRHLLLLMLMALSSCADTKYTDYGVDPNCPDARAWISGIVAVERIDDSFDKSHHLNAYR